MIAKLDLSSCSYNELENESDNNSCPVKKFEFFGDHPKPEKPKAPVKNPLRSIIFALCAGLLFSLSNYILGSHSGLGILAREVVGNGSLLYAILYTFYKLGQSLCYGTNFWAWERSNFRHPETGGFYWENLAGLCVYMFVNLVSGFLVVFTFQFALIGHINQGIITCLFGLSGIFSAVIAFFMFNEKLKRHHWIGILFMFICVVGLGLGSTFKSPTPTEYGSDENHLVEGLLCILLGICCPLTFSFSGLCVRYMSENYSFDSFDMTISSYYGLNIFLIIAMVFTYEYGTHPFIWSEYIQIVLSGLMGSIGVLALNYALTIGYAGPVFALANCQVIIQTFLDIVFQHQFPTALEVVSALFGIIGSCTIAVGPQIYEKFKSILDRNSSEDESDEYTKF